MPPHPRSSSNDSLSGLRRYTWFAQLGLPLTMTVPTTNWIIRQTHTVIATVGLLAVVYAVIAVVMWWYIIALRDTPPPLTWLDAVVFSGASMALLGAALWAASIRSVVAAWPLLAGFLVSVLASRLPPHKRLFPCVLVTLGYSAVAVGMVRFGLVNEAAPLITGGIVALVGWSMYSGYWNFETGRQLDRARRVESELAVTQERLRFAAELHDIQGHHLQVIALKSELAARLAERDAAKAADNMAQVQQLARDALSDTRAVVAGYRQVGVATELTNAARVLEASGVQTRTSVPDGALEVDEGTGKLLGLLVREATTNMLRHARPTHATVDVLRDGSDLAFTIDNDGASGAKAEAGSGLASLRDRFAKVGGALNWSHTGDRFSLHAKVCDTEAPS